MLVKEFEEEKRVMKTDHASQLKDSRTELVALQRRHDLQDREMAHVKRLARKILDERTEMETFFMEALAHVRKEIAANRYGLHACTCMYMHFACMCMMTMRNICHAGSGIGVTHKRCISSSSWRPRGGEGDSPRFAPSKLARRPAPIASTMTWNTQNPGNQLQISNWLRS